MLLRRPERERLEGQSLVIFHKLECRAAALCGIVRSRQRRYSSSSATAANAESS